MGRDVLRENSFSRPEALTRDRSGCARERGRVYIVRVESWQSCPKLIREQEKQEQRGDRP